MSRVNDIINNSKDTLLKEQKRLYDEISKYYNDCIYILNKIVDIAKEIGEKNIYDSVSKTLDGISERGDLLDLSKQKDDLTIDNLNLDSFDRLYDILLKIDNIYKSSLEQFSNISSLKAEIKFCDVLIYLQDNLHFDESNDSLNNSNETRK